jgi:monomeric sarcosine oxidase
MRRLTRRALLTGSAMSAAGMVLMQPGTTQEKPAAGSKAPSPVSGWDTVVVGAGVFGAWTAWHLLRKGRRVLLLDAWGPAHSRASSGGESRMTRTAYGPDEVYTRMAWESLADWKWLSDQAGLPVFHRLGVLFFFPKQEPYVNQTLEVHRRLNIPIESLQRAELVKRFPQFSWADIEIGLFEPQLGALMARRAVQTLVSQFVAQGGEYRVAAVQSPRGAQTRGALESIVTSEGERLRASQYVFACGPWLPKVFPDVLGSRIFVTRQEVFFFSPPRGDSRYLPGHFPGWADFNGGDIYYGFPDLEARGVKVAHDKHGPRMDPDTGDREASAAALAEVRAFMRHRFPALAERPLNEARVCQYENSSNGDFLIDHHPLLENVLLVGTGSGHGFKHGPAVGRYAAQLLTSELKTAEPRFSLSTKGDVQDRAVH